MVIIAPTGNPLKTAQQLHERGWEIYSEGRYLRAYPTTIPAEG